MNNIEIYNIMIRECLNKLKILRDQIEIDFTINDFDPTPLYEISNKDGFDYCEIMRRSEEIIEWGVINTIATLLKEYGHETELLRIMMTRSIEVEKDGNKRTIPIQSSEPKKRQYVFIAKQNGKRILYITKKFGFSKRFSPNAIKELNEEYDFDDYCFLTLVEDGAYLEVINHNLNENDPCRGTHNISLKAFFNDFFSAEEYDCFKEHLDTLLDYVKEYYGLSVFKALVPNALYRFKNLVTNNFKLHTQTHICIPSDQRTIIERQLYDSNTLELLFGGSSFAQCYITAEWLYESMKTAKNIDYTVVSLGYFKLIEQLLFAYVSRHTIELDPIPRKIYELKSQQRIPLTNQSINDPDKLYTLNSFAGFFGFYSQKHQKYIYNCPDLFIAGLSEQTKNSVIDDLNSIKELRNEFFHRENITNWNDVEKHRVMVHKALYWILGALKYSTNDLNALGYVSTRKSDYQALCQYTHTLSLCSIYESLRGADYAWSPKDNQEEFGIDSNRYICTSYVLRLYADEETVVLEGSPQPDRHIDYKNINEPMYSGVYIKLNTEKPITSCIDENNLPYKITVASVKTSTSIPLQGKIDDEYTIYKDGKYMLSQR